MKCDHCENEATVHEVTVRSGVKIEKHLCEACAQQQGMGGVPSMPLSELMTKFLLTNPVAAGATAPTTARAPACPTCRTSFAEFRQSGTLGCPDCYRAFEPQLAPLLERAHEGGVRHSGKSPRRAVGGGKATPPAVRASVAALQQRAERLRSVRRELDAAVAAEQYERAAQLRDELQRLTSSGPGATA